MSWLFRILRYLILARAKVEALTKAKTMAMVGYMRVLQGARRALIFALMGFFVLQLAVLALVGALVTAFALWDYDPHAKLQILLGIFLVLFLVPAGVLTWALSESVWYRYSGAKKMVDRLRGES